MKCWNDVIVPNNITEFVVGDNKCNAGGIVMDMSIYTELKRISIGDESFINMIGVNIEGLNNLESVSIGMNSFTHYSYYRSNRKLYIGNCPLLKEVRIDRYSFSNYGSLYVENLESLELIEFGDVAEESQNFYNSYYASFESKRR